MKDTLNLNSQAPHELDKLRDHGNRTVHEFVQDEESEEELRLSKECLSRREKELDCLYDVNELAEQCKDSLDDFLQALAKRLPGAWQYPEVTCACVTYQGRQYLSPGFKKTRWKQEAEIFVKDGTAGSVKVYYLDQRPLADEGPFLREERKMINAVAARVGAVIEQQQTQHALQERIKELNCLYSITELVDRCGMSLDRFFQGVVEILPESWQYPEITCARIVFGDGQYTSPNFEATRWRQAAAIPVNGEMLGSVEVFYRTSRPPADEGPFLKEERMLINAVAERIGRVVQRINAEQHLQAELEFEREALGKANTAMREILSSIDDQKRDVADAVQTNVDNVVMPILHSLESEISQHLKGHVKLLQRNLEDIASPFADSLSKAFLSLTPVEISICNMIRRGMSTKQIAEIRRISPATVSRHREHIRQKLNITNKSINLTTFLQSFLQDAEGSWPEGADSEGADS